MFYFKVREYGNDYVSNKIYSSEKKLDKDDVVVISDYDDEPITARVVEKVKDFYAMTSDREIEPIIGVVDMKGYLERLEKGIKKALLLKKMNDKVTEVKNIEQLKKYSEKDEDMRVLMKELEELNRSEEQQDEE